MRNLKKVLSLALALVMLVGMMVVGAGAVETDFPDNGKIGDDYKEAVAVMSAIGVLGGKETGNFDPQGTLTRAEAAKILCVMTMGSDAAKGLANVNKSGVFTDMADHWAAGYVDACYNKGIVLGMAQGIYGPSNTLTGTQFAAMLLRAVGVEGEFTGPSWESAVIAAAAKAKLSEVTTKPIAREAASKMSFDGLNYTEKGEETGRYEIVAKAGYSGAALDLAGVVCESKTEALLLVNTMDAGNKANYDYKAEKDNSGSLAADVFGLSSADSADTSGNPIKVWSSTKDSSVNVVVEKGTTLTYTKEVDGKTIWNDLGKNSKITTATVIEDGVAKANLSLNKTSSSKVGGAGTLTSVYRSGSDVTITVVNTYVGTIAKVTAAKGEDKAYVMVDSMKYETEDFEKNDVVLYTKGTNDEGKTVITSMQLAEEVTGKLEKITNGKKWTVDGTEYANSAKSAVNLATAGNVGRDVTFYVDTQNNIIKVKDAAAAESSFIYVLAVAEPVKNSDYVVSSSVTQEVYGILADGTVDRYTVSKLGGSPVAKTSNEVAPGLYSYTPNTDNSSYYDLTSITNSTPKADIGVNATVTEINTSNAKLKLNSSTVFVFYTTGSGSDKTVKDITVKTGIANIGDTIDKSVANVGGKDGVAKIVFVGRSFESITDTSTVVYVTDVSTSQVVGGTEYTASVLTAEGDKDTYTSKTEPHKGEVWTVSEEGALSKKLSGTSTVSGIITAKAGNNYTIGASDSLFQVEDTLLVDTTGAGIIELEVGQTVEIVKDGNTANMAVVFVEKNAGDSGATTPTVSTNPGDGKTYSDSNNSTAKVKTEVTVDNGVSFKLPSTTTPVTSTAAVRINDNVITDWGDVTKVMGFTFAIDKVADMGKTFTFSLKSADGTEKTSDTATCGGKVATGVFYFNFTVGGGKNVDLTDGETYFWTITKSGTTPTEVAHGSFTWADPE